MILKLQQTLLTLKMLGVMECAPTPSSIVFMLGFAFESFKELGGMSLCIPPFAHAYRLVWWWTRGGLFSNVGFFAKQFMRIPKFQIEIKIMLNMFNVLTTMWHCCL
jgi:hypothetical protein